MFADEYAYPVAVSQVGASDSREAQSARAITWLLEQPGGPVVVVTPQKQFDCDSLRRLVMLPGTRHLTWKGLSVGSFAGRRVIHAWPSRKHLNEMWGVQADAVVVIEWGFEESAEWVEDARPVRLLPGQTIARATAPVETALVDSLPADVEQILESIARWAAGYDSGLKWNEEDKLKADMMNCPERWVPVTVEQVRTKCRELKMRPDDVDTVAGFLERRKQGRRFNVRGSYRDFRFS
ncbi:hypothetical protein N1031_10665 [Herbiconiux moechotypicola]|uniref:Uncharacterized protein n=1 Tax=Herbiconiux moechotypicola TaxID=637393 RepID=A0ABP5QHI3_9MICO|nr:hypothetical protein [Herbiconiux moechotypicola]MCS5730222.1 hypothetical protein [Herbiconiux moechotypicola]